ncbi:hypothetical protein [Leptospira adleri]|uniref:Uncharacterized protein n=1 Tax=Leptospira adleri TaxID=2023186 RepID=A0A2M9YPT5_9LEPT|nr:hypothetical protein [Leptospira adleri]PJZ53535.1 hypothetical protein CH380_10170 [Leptospira adleri]PJZ62212.1 hypothetical protein CH376_09060 [Leptospira adleri]
MGGGYHSRSPEEFRKFLEESRKRSSSGRFSRVKLIFVLNLVLVVLVVGMVVKTMTPGAFSVQSSSSKLRIGSALVYVKSSREGKEGVPTFFLFMKNEGHSKELRFPEEDRKFRILLSNQEGLNCLEKDWDIIERNLDPGKIEFARFQFDEKEFLSLPLDCRIQSEGSFLEKIFRRKSNQSGLKLEVKISGKEGENVLTIQNL